MAIKLSPRKSAKGKKRNRHQKMLMRRAAALERKQQRAQRRLEWNDHIGTALGRRDVDILHYELTKEVAFQVRLQGDETLEDYPGPKPSQPSRPDRTTERF